MKKETTEGTEDAEGRGRQWGIGGRF